MLQGNFMQFTKIIKDIDGKEHYYYEDMLLITIG